MDELRHGLDVGPVLSALVSMTPSVLERLATDQYANFVIKLGLLDTDGTRRAKLIGQLLPRLGVLSVTRWGSHVAKAAVSVASRAQLDQMRAVLTSEGAPELRTHPYGGFVKMALDRAIARAL